MSFNFSQNLSIQHRKDLQRKSIQRRVKQRFDICGESPTIFYKSFVYMAQITNMSTFSKLCIFLIFHIYFIFFFVFFLF